jgi:hypothetical protein
LLAKEALDVLALRPGATSVEIKEAYRDLVKVWHPDRFGSDARLRQKAEEKLKQINEAYLILQSDRGTSETYAAEPEEARSSTNHGAWWANSFSARPTRRNDRVRGNRIPAGIGWLYGGMGIALGLMEGYVTLEHGRLQSARATSASVQRVEGASEETGPAIPAAQTPGEALAGRGVSSAESRAGNVPPQRPGGSNRLSSAQFGFGRCRVLRPTGWNRRVRS